MGKTTKLVIDVWPKLIEGLQHDVGWLGSDPADVAKFLIIEGLERRRCEGSEYRRAELLAEVARRR